MTRRHLLLAAAQAGGVSFGYRLMEELALVNKPEPTDLDALIGATPKKATVLILGAGIGGMCAAHELEQLGFQCTLLEARHRTGGRCYTVRRGDVVEETGLTQRCEFEPGAYFNPGPTRIPYWHSTIDYCRKFNVALAPWVNVNHATYIYQAQTGKHKGQKIRVQDAIADTTGYMAELAARSVSAGQLDAPLSADEKAAVLRYIGQFGFLDRDGRYRGSERRGYASFAGAGPGKSEFAAPYPFADLFGAGMGNYFQFIDGNDQQMTMLEIVGGVDNLAKAFQAHLRSPIHFGCEVTNIRTSTTGVTITYKDAGGKLVSQSADYCICTIPLTVLRKIPANFDAPTQAAIRSAFYANSVKVAHEFRRRFWEEDERIFGGISWTDQPIGQVIYPSHHFFSKSGVLVNYSLGFSQALSGLPVDKRVQAALEMTAKIHPQAPKEVKSGVTLSWAGVPFNQGAFVSWEFTPNGEAGYQLLCQPQGRVYFAGEHASRIASWMAGAIESARFVVKNIAVAAQAG
jgi:monoamine oxidase